MSQQSPHQRARSLRRAGSELIFAWGSVVSVAFYAVLMLLGRPPLLDDHITATAVSMLVGYLIMRFALDVWCFRMNARRRQELENG